MATWVMAYIRASAGDGPTGEMQAATAALPALSFQAPTGSERAPVGARRARPAPGGPEAGRADCERDALHRASADVVGGGGGR